MALDHALFMEQAITLALQNVLEQHGGPFGAIIVKNGTVIAEGTNKVTATFDPTAHAEIVAIRAACKKLSSHQLVGCTIYSSCEPCPMCLGAIFWARPEALFFAATRQDAATVGFDDEFIYQQIALPPEARTLPTKQLVHPKALMAFSAWQQANNKIPY